MMKKLTQSFLLCCSLFFLFSTSYATEERIKVAFIQDNPFYSLEVNGGYSGYNYDYLMKVAQYTDWNYEFVEIQGEEEQTAEEIAEEMLKNGEIDLLGSMFFTEETAIEFEFGEKNYGVARYSLCVLENNNKITANTFFLQEQLSVALIKEDEYALNSFESIMRNNKMEGVVTFVENDQEALELLKQGEVDCIMALDVSFNGSNLTSVTTLSPVPFYFASTKGNSQLLEELDRAISEIERTEFVIQQQLTQEHFGLKHVGNITLSEDEKEALKDYPYLTVGLLRSRAPYQFFSAQEGEPQGISVEILEEISEIIGVEFRYVWLDTREEMRDKIASREIDLCSTVPYDSDYDLTYFFDVVLTQPYLTNAVSWLHHSEEKSGVNPHYYYLADNIPLFPDEELTEVFDFEEYLWLLSEKGNISLFADPYMAQYQIQKLGITNIEMQIVSSMESKICFGVGKHLDSAVVGLLNHAILHLDPFVVDEIIYSNVTVQGTISVKAFINEHIVDISMWLVAILLIIVLISTYSARKFRTLSREDSLTKLYNAGYFHHYAEMTTTKISRGCLILLDIDFFKQVNDGHGHHAGDKVIQAVAQVLKEHFKGKDTVARLGGDEFVILLEGECSTEDLEQRCKEILQTLSTASSHVPVSLSIGGFIFEKPSTYEELYREADAVLYKVKENGRNGFLFQTEDKKEF